MLEESYGNSMCAHITKVLDFMKKKKEGDIEETNFFPI